MATKILLNGGNLTSSLLQKIATERTKVEFAIAPASRERMQRSRDFVYEIVRGRKVVYGINTGFGALSDKHIPRKDLEKLQYNLIRSHCTGVGRPFDPSVVRAIMVVRANCLVSGHSGVAPELVDLYLQFVNKGVAPIVPEKGSVGASGDLAPLAHIALALIGEGEVIYRGKQMAASKALKSVLHARPAKLGPKDGLALINGTAVMTAIGALALEDAKMLARAFDIAGAMTVEGTKGTDRAFSEEISRVRPQEGQLLVAQNLRRLMEGSQVRASHLHCGKVQDSYSLRCIPQVHGAVRQTITHTDRVLAIELNSVTDNPLIFPETKEVISGGNFHGEPVALALDYLTMGVAELCSISERRVEKMMNASFSNLPSFLTKKGGLHSGLMMAHVTHAALTSENKVLAHPASVDSIPTSTDKEDHVSMGVSAARKLSEVIENAKHCLAIEFLANTQALEFLHPTKSSPVLESVYRLIRKRVPAIGDDRVFAKDLQSIYQMINSGEIVAAAESVIGPLA
ncbi:MAG: histidine ammonia-lyase [Oligoflexia bacterium]|nr:histidine ammonia-lyase [Oligoflexia bacterium]